MSGDRPDEPTNTPHYFEVVLDDTLGTIAAIREGGPRGRVIATYSDRRQRTGRVFDSIAGDVCDCPPPTGPEVSR